MANVVAFRIASQRQNAAITRAHLLQSFAHHRRDIEDVFWLKENAELLNIIECSGGDLSGDALAPYQEFYDGMQDKLRFFPQYYRFLLSLCLDLEDLGMAGTTGEAAVAWAAREGVARAEMSDLQRLEARRLMGRRGVDPFPQDRDLEARLRGFMSRNVTFALPNKKAAYELTHIVFYLSEYGRVDPQLDDAAILSLEFAGIMAFLEQNADLLAEVCIALRYAGARPSAMWEQWLERHTHRIQVEAGEHISVQDDYHEYLVCNWFLGASGRDAFAKAVAPERVRFDRAAMPYVPLRELSQYMYDMNDARGDDWAVMRDQVFEALSEDAQVVLTHAEASSPAFGEFFQGFARAGSLQVAM